MNTENRVKGVPVKRWLDMALLTYTLAGPFINTLTKRLRQSGRPEQTRQEEVQATQPDMRQRLNELTLESQQWVAEQVQQLNEQARQLQVQSRQLRKATRRMAKQRRKLVAQLRESGIELGKDLLKRSERMTEELVERGGKITQDLLERSGEFTHDLAERGEHLLEPVRKRDRNFWALVGFGVGMVVAGVVTYRLVRQRMVQLETGQDEHIELPQSDSWDGKQSRPVGEILHIDQGGISVATLEIVDVETNERPADAAFVGVMSTKLYYPVDTDLEPEDVVYFLSEEDARIQGFTPAE